MARLAAKPLFDGVASLRDPRYPRLGRSKFHRLPENVVMALLLAACCVVCRAQARPGPYIKTVWTTEEGLPQNSVTSMAQTRDGYIWFGTFGGLVRFDGIKFKIFNTINAPAIKSNRIPGCLKTKPARCGLARSKATSFLTKTKPSPPLSNRRLAQAARCKSFAWTRTGLCGRG